MIQGCSPGSRLSLLPHLTRALDRRAIERDRKSIRDALAAKGHARAEKGAEAQLG